MGPDLSRTLPESDGLDEHLLRCRCAAGRGFALRCGAERVHGFLAARFVSTLLGVWLLVWLLVWLVSAGGAGPQV